MYRNQGNGLVVDKHGTDKPGFTDGDPMVNNDGTVVEAEFMDHVQEELAAIVEADGQAVDGANLHQVLNALDKIGAGVFGGGTQDVEYAAGSHSLSVTDLVCRNLTLRNGATLDTGDMRIFVSGELRMETNSKIRNNGASASSSSGVGGIASALSWYQKSGATGGDAGTGAGDAGGHGFFGGAGGDGGDSSNAGGDGGDSSKGPQPYHTFLNAVAGQSQTLRKAGGGGGGGATPGGAPTGGGGGGGGGMIFIAAFNPVEMEGVIEALGGDGADGTAGNTGGGGGGGGGCIMFASRRPIPDDANLEFVVDGGDGGAGHGTGSAGAAGEDGYVAVMRM